MTTNSEYVKYRCNTYEEWVKRRLDINSEGKQLSLWLKHYHYLGTHKIYFVVQNNTNIDIAKDING